jgi:hypothetical protein
MQDLLGNFVEFAKIFWEHCSMIFKDQEWINRKKVHLHISMNLELSRLFMSTQNRRLDRHKPINFLAQIQVYLFTF